MTNVGMRRSDHGRRMDARRRGQHQIDDTVKDAVLRARALTPQGESAEECDDCGEPIPKKRRDALPGVRTCVACQSERDKARRPLDHQPPRQQG